MTGHEIWAQLQKPGKKLPKPPKRMAQKGRRTLEYEQWRDETAIPYLDKTYGHVCSKAGCNRTENLDVDHIETRGAHPELKMDLSNVRYLCRPHHRERQ